MTDRARRFSRPTTRMAAAGFRHRHQWRGSARDQSEEYVGNPFLCIKIPAIGLALLNVFLVHRSSAWRAHKNRDLTLRERRRLAAMGGTSLFFWLASIGAGRMIGYW
jgi:hypothetical protein